MRAFIIFIGMWLAVQCASAQLSDTIYVNEQSTVSLVFPETITLIDLGNSDFLANVDGSLALLKASSSTATTTNLLIRYGENQFFMGWVVYKARLSDYYFDYRTNEVETGSVKMPVQKKEPVISDTPAVAACLDTVMALSAGTKTISKSRNEISLTLKTIRNGPDHTYLAVWITNTSTLPFRVRDIRVEYREKPHKRGLADITKSLPFVTARLPKEVAPNSSVLMGCAFTQFGVGKRGRLYVMVSERSGTRSITLPVKSKFIIHAQMLPSDEKAKENHSTSGI